MHDRLEHYIDLCYGYYSRAMRRIRWNSRYYVLPAYQRFVDDDRLQLLRSRLQAWIGTGRRRWPRASRYLLNRYAASLAVVILFTTVGAAALSAAKPHKQPATVGTAAAPTAADPMPSQPKTATAPSATPKPAPSAQPASVPAPSAAKPFLFGIGPQLDGAMRSRIYRDAPVGMLTSWYNGPDDLNFMRGWQSTRVPQAYAEGKALHLVIFTDGPETNFNTKYGPACGRTYPFSASFASDMQQLASIYKGSGTLYVSMFTELQTYPCQDNTWRGSENYYKALKDQYRQAMDIFHTNAPNSQVSLSWGGWQARWDDKANGAGRSLIPHFADVMGASDFQSFQAMHSTGNVQDISDMTGLLHAYGNGRVMVAHYKPDNSSQTTWRNDLEGIFTPGNMAALQQRGLFAFSFMDEKNMGASETAYQQARQVIQTYAR